MTQLLSTQFLPLAALDMVHHACFGFEPSLIHVCLYGLAGYALTPVSIGFYTLSHLFLSSWVISGLIPFLSLILPFGFLFFFFSNMSGTYIVILLTTGLFRVIFFLFEIGVSNYYLHRTQQKLAVNLCNY